MSWFSDSSATIHSNHPGRFHEKSHGLDSLISRPLPKMDLPMAKLKTLSELEATKSDHLSISSSNLVDIKPIVQSTLDTKSFDVLKALSKIDSRSISNIHAEGNLSQQIWDKPSHHASITSEMPAIQPDVLLENDSINNQIDERVQSIGQVHNHIATNNLLGTNAISSLTNTMIDLTHDSIHAVQVPVDLSMPMVSHGAKIQDHIPKALNEHDEYQPLTSQALNDGSSLTTRNLNELNVRSSNERTITLRDWCIKIEASKSGQPRVNVYVLGHNGSSLWTTTSIVMRLDKDLVSTKNRTMYQLVGSMAYSKWKEFVALSQNIISKFGDGFPEDWHTLCQDEAHHVQSCSKVSPPKPPSLLKGLIIPTGHQSNDHLLDLSPPAKSSRTASPTLPTPYCPVDQNQKASQERSITPTKNFKRSKKRPPSLVDSNNGASLSYDSLIDLPPLKRLFDNNLSRLDITNQRISSTSSNPSTNPKFHPGSLQINGEQRFKIIDPFPALHSNLNLNLETLPSLQPSPSPPMSVGQIKKGKLKPSLNQPFSQVLDSSAPQVQVVYVDYNDMDVPSEDDSIEDAEYVDFGESAYDTDGGDSLEDIHYDSTAFFDDDSHSRNVHQLVDKERRPTLGISKVSSSTSHVDRHQHHKSHRVPSSQVKPSYYHASSSHHHLNRHGHQHTLYQYPSHTQTSTISLGQEHAKINIDSLAEDKDEILSMSDIERWEEANLSGSNSSMEEPLPPPSYKLHSHSNTKPIHSSRDYPVHPVTHITNNSLDNFIAYNNSEEDLSDSSDNKMEQVQAYSKHRSAKTKRPSMPRSIEQDLKQFLTTNSASFKSIALLPTISKPTSTPILPPLTLPVKSIPTYVASPSPSVITHLPSPENQSALYPMLLKQTYLAPSKAVVDKPKSQSQVTLGSKSKFKRLADCSSTTLSTSHTLPSPLAIMTPSIFSSFMTNPNAAPNLQPLSTTLTSNAKTFYNDIDPSHSNGPSNTINSSNQGEPSNAMDSNHGKLSNITNANHDQTSNKVDSSHPDDPNVWTQKQLSQLQAACSSISPHSLHYYRDLAERVEGKSAESIRQRLVHQSELESSSSTLRSLPSRSKSVKSKSEMGDLRNPLPMEQSPLTLESNMRLLKNRKKLRKAIQINAISHHRDDAFDSPSLKQAAQSIMTQFPDYDQEINSPISGEKDQPSSLPIEDQDHVSCPSESIHLDQKSEVDDYLDDDHVVANEDQDYLDNILHMDRDLLDKYLHRFTKPNQAKFPNWNERPLWIGSSNIQPLASANPIRLNRRRTNKVGDPRDAAKIIREIESLAKIKHAKQQALDNEEDHCITHDDDDDETLETILE